MVAFGTAVVVLVSVQPVAGAASDLVVSSPSDPVTIVAGSTASTTIVVGNLGFDPMEVDVRAADVRLLDNGATRFVPGSADPVFGKGITIQPSTLRLAGRTQEKVSITVTAPAKLAPNDYFLGFLVTPVVSSTSVTVINQVGALVVLDVPGSRDERLSASFVGLPGIAFFGSADGAVLVHSIGRSTVQFTTDTVLSGFPSSKQRVVTEPPQLLPPGLSRREPVHVSSWLGIGWMTLHTTLVYNLTDQRTGEVTLSKTILLISPIWFTVPVALVSGIVFLLLRRQRRPGATSSRSTAVRGVPRRPVPA